MIATISTGRAHRPSPVRDRDRGCFVAPACAACPFPVCVYDDPRGPRGARLRPRDTEITRLYHSGWTVRALTRRFAVSRRHIFRILARVRREEHTA